MAKWVRVLMWPAVVLACFGAVAPASAQTITTGTLTGVVEDQQGGALPGATVTATQEATGTTYTAVTQADGRYLILNVKIGTYVLKISMSGFKDAEAERRRREPRRREDDEVLDAARRDGNGHRDGRDAADRPLARGHGGQRRLARHRRPADDFAQRLRLRAHVAVLQRRAAYSATDDTAVSVAGRNNRYNNMQIDGAVSNDVFGLSTTGTPGGQTGTQPISLDAIQEIQLVVSSYDVRQGGFTGGGVNAVTKSGIEHAARHGATTSAATRA